MTVLILSNILLMVKNNFIHNGMISGQTYEISLSAEIMLSVS